MPKTLSQTVPPRRPETDDEGLLRILDGDGVVIADARTPSLGAERELAIYRSMRRTRMLGRAMERLQRQGRVAFHVSSMGEEGAIVGAAEALTSDDWIVPCYREIGALLHRAEILDAYLDMMFGNADDEALGHQMPEHSSGRAHRYASVSAPIGTQITHAVGMGYALSLKHAEEVVAVFFGDGATSSNDFHAGMTMAALWRAPVLFLCRNNRWAISLPANEQCAAAHLADKAIGYGMPAIRVDGNDPLAVHLAVREARERALKREGPTFVELDTYRQSGHSTSDDPGVYRHEEELRAFVARDPLMRMRRRLELVAGWDDAREASLEEEIEAELSAAIKRAEKKPKPEVDTLFDHVFETRTKELERQAEEARRSRERGGAR